MESEMKNFVKVWVLSVTCLLYCYFVVSKIPKGKFRLLSLLPIFYLFIVLPLDIYSFHFALFTSAYITWLGNFKLLLFSFDQGPLSSSDQPKSLVHFISVAALPIKVKQNPSQSTKVEKNPFQSTKAEKNPYQSTEVEKNPSQSTEVEKNPSDQSTKAEKNPSQSTKVEKNPSSSSSSPLITSRGSKLLLNFLVKALILHLLVRIHEYKQYINSNIMLAFYCLHLYLTIELCMALSVAPARALLLGFDIEPQFNEPYLSTSLQDFWGRRWNLMISSILKSTVYVPIRSISKPILGRTWALLLAVLFTFIVSGLMHELMFYYVTRAGPTGEVASFFLLQGIFTTLEIALKKAVGGRWRLPPWVSAPLTVAFVTVTGYWLFFPQLLRNGIENRAIREYRVVAEFLFGK